RSGIALARKVGDRRWERILLGELAMGLERTGQWQDALEAINQIPEHALLQSYVYSAAEAHAKIAIAQGEPAVAHRLLELFAELEDSPDLQVRTFFYGLRGLILKSEGRHEQARDAFLTSVSVAGVESGSETAKAAAVQSIECALALSDCRQAEELLGRLATLRPGELPPFLRGNHARLGARLAAARGEQDGVEPGFATAAGVFREFDLPFD